MSSFGIGTTTLGTYYNVNKDSEFAAQSMENAMKYSGHRREKVLQNLVDFVPEAAEAYFVEISSQDDDD